MKKLSILLIAAFALSSCDDALFVAKAPANLVGFTLANVTPNQTYFIVGAETAITYNDGKAFMAGDWGSKGDATWDSTVADRTFVTDATGGVAKTFSKPVIFGAGGFKWTEGGSWAYEIGPGSNGSGDFTKASFTAPEAGDYRLKVTGSGNVAKNQGTLTVVR